VGVISWTRKEKGKEKKGERVVVGMGEPLRMPEIWYCKGQSKARI
jgi:hypothetical protein